MPSAAPSTAAKRRLFLDLWRLTRIYWTSPDATIGGLLLALAIALELATVYANVLIAEAQRGIGDSLQDMDGSAFFRGMGIFFAYVVVFLLVSTYRIWIRQRLEMRWRRVVTTQYLSKWMATDAYVHSKLHSDDTDNPDQRIAEDIRSYVASALGLSLSLLAAIATLVSFGDMLWTLSGDWPLTLGEVKIRIPGLMMWVAVVYALVASGLTHWVGRSLIRINFDRLRVEADFRYGLIRFRENVEAVTLAHGEESERTYSAGRFSRVVDNWHRLIAAQRNLNLFTGAIGQTNSVVPLLVAAPAYFAGHLTLGSLLQTRAAYGQVAGALAWFVNAYQEIAQWRASIERLSAFTDSMEASHADRVKGAGIRVVSTPDPAFRIRDLSLALPDGRVLLEDINGELVPGARVAILGPSGTGKTTFLRALAGIWPFGSGRIEVPVKGNTLFLSHRPYLPIGSLRAAVSYPSPADAFSDQQIGDVFAQLELSHLMARLDETRHWEQDLSSDEQQRLIFARVLLQEPAWLFMDDATAEISERMERRVYELLHERMPNSAVMSITNREAVAAYHTRKWLLSPGGDGEPTQYQRV
jgi:putative ATP-binding cassette transporter